MHKSSLSEKILETAPTETTEVMTESHKNWTANYFYGWTARDVADVFGEDFKLYMNFNGGIATEFDKTKVPYVFHFETTDHTTDDISLYADFLVLAIEVLEGGYIEYDLYANFTVNEMLKLLEERDVNISYDGELYNGGFETEDGLMYVFFVFESMDSKPRYILVK